MSNASNSKNVSSEINDENVISSIVEGEKIIKSNENAKTDEEHTAHQLQEIVISVLKNVECGKELLSLQNILLPEPWSLHNCSLIVKQDLCRILQSMHPIRVELFGSTVMGIAFKGSDFDFYIQLLEPIRDTSELLYRVMHQLDFSKSFKEFKVVTRARIPILKCVHASTGFQCDLNFTNMVGVYNSRIMARLISFDGRIHALAMMVKSWLKVHNLIGSKCITSYSALWLLLFYLQQLKQPILPPIEVFQRFSQPFYIQSANVAFNFQTPNNLCNMQLGLELFMGFFEFYDKFDFESQIICPYLGRALLRKNFLETLPHNFVQHRHLFQMNPSISSIKLKNCICIQDPFELHHTIPAKLSKQYFHHFRMAMGNAANICRKKMSSFNERDLLLKLFDSTILTKPLTDKNGKISGDHLLSFQLRPFQSEMKIIKQISDLLQSADDILIQNRLWAEYSIEFLMRIFQDIFRFDIDKSMLDDKNKLSKRLHVTGEYDVTFKRTQLHPSDERFLDREQTFSKNTRRKLNKTFKAVIHICADQENYDIIFVDFKQLNTNVFNSLILSRIREYKVSYFEKYMTETMQLI